MMKSNLFPRFLFTSMLLTALAAAGALYAGGATAFAQQPSPAQPSPQASPTAAAQAATPSPPQPRGAADAQAAASPEENDGRAAENEGQAARAPREEGRKPLSWDYWVVGAILLVLALLFYLLINYSSRLENSNYLGTVFRDTVEETEFRSLAGPYREKWANFGYHEHAQRDPEVQRRIREAERNDDAAAAQAPASGSGTGTGGPPTWVGTGGGGSWGGMGTSPRPGTGTGPGYHEEVERHAKKNYNADLDRARTRAKDRASRVVTGVDWNVLRGRGPEFVLEFTAVVVLVFAVVILGLLHILESQPIATLLAAIAGYVLGRASTRKPGAEGSGSRSTAEVIELIRAVSGATQPAAKAPPRDGTQPAAASKAATDGSAAAPAEQPAPAAAAEAGTDEDAEGKS